MDLDLYKYFFKRKSFHTFNGLEEKLTKEELDSILNYLNNDVTHLYKDIKVKFEIVPANKTTCKRNEEYCILMYSETKKGYLQNIGYIGEQLDLYLTKNHIASLWCGLARPLIMPKLMKFVIMFAISKCSDDSKYRKDMYKAKRKELDEIWFNDSLKDIGNIVRFTPSACNSQPWIIEGDNKTIIVNRYTKEGKSGLMPELYAHYYNSIDIGIFMYILELTLQSNNIEFEVKYFKEDKPKDRKYKNAEYIIK